jgi:hypothetical protein
LRKCNGGNGLRTEALALEIHRKPHVEIVSSPNHSNDNPDVHLVEDELREGLENSRQLVRRSHYLIELAGSDGASSGEDDECSIAN